MMRAIGWGVGVKKQNAWVGQKALRLHRGGRKALWYRWGWGVGLLSLYGNLVDAALVAPSLKIGGEKLVEDLAGHVVVDEAARQDKHVGVVVLADEMCNLGYPAQASADALVLVERHGDALARSADADAGVDLAALHPLGQGVAEVGIVAAFLAEGAIILISDASLVEVLLDKLF